MIRLFFFFFLAGVCFSKLFAQGKLNFFHITPKIENENILVKNIAEDKLGYIWMSYKEGIAKYNGYDFSYYPYKTIFKKDSVKNSIKKILVDKKGVLWILNSKGLLSKRLTNGEFVIHDQHFANDSIALIQNVFVKGENIWFVGKNNTIYAKHINHSKIDSITNINGKEKKSAIYDLDITKTGDLIISTNKGEIYRYFTKLQTLKKINAPFSKSPGYTTVVLDKKDNLWVGTESLGLFHYNLKKESIIKHSFLEYKQGFLAHDRILTLFCDKDGIIWAGSDGEGLYRVDPDTGAINLYKNNFLNKFSLSSNSIIDITEDSNRNLWVVSNYGDLNIIPRGNSDIFYHPGSVKKNPVRVLSMLKGFDGTIWIGTDGNGLTKVPPFNKLETQIFTQKDSNKGFYIQTLEEDQDKNIWIGTYKNGLWFYDRKEDTYSKIEVLNSSGLKATNIENLFKDSKGRIWVGSNLGLDIFLEKEKKLASFTYGTKGLFGDIIRSIAEDSNNNIWIGMDGSGLFKFEEVSKIKDSYFQNFKHSSATKGQYFSIANMVATTDGKLWLLDNDELILFDTVDFSFKEYKNFEAFKEAGFLAVLLENNNNLWISSTKGIWNFTVNDSVVKRFNKTDGFQDDFFIHGSAYKDNLGYLYFGGLYGLNKFHPSLIKKIEQHNKVYISDIKILNKTALEIIPEQTLQGIEQVSDIELKYNQSSFSFNFSAIGNILNSDFYYAHRLKGFNNDWVISKNERLATYTNIPPGNYTFEVKAGTKRGLWDIPVKSVNILIAKPFWDSPLAYVVYLVVFGFVIWRLYKWILLRRDLLTERIRGDQEKELYILKMNFFAKMSHEIQTPLTLIKAPTDDLLKRLKDSPNLLLKQRLETIANNATRLSRITNQLTMVRNKELDQLKLKVVKKDVIKEIKNITASFYLLAQSKHIDLVEEHFCESYILWIDLEKVEHILYNILSNAFKFTPSEGKIILKTYLNSKTNMFNISISDTGEGIPKEEQDNVFELFYQTNIGAQQNGTGIGLAFVKELITLHKGKVFVDSENNEGARFNILLPTDEDVYSKTEKVIELEVNLPLKPDEREYEELNFSTYKQPKKIKYTILIVEDDYEMQFFLQSVFSKSYKVFVAKNGKEGLDMAISVKPDLIVSDISMPIMNGIEMCRELVKNNNTSHIPVILLTARNTTETKLRGLENGAIEFINKPFNIEELHLKIQNVLTVREKAFVNSRLKLISEPKGVEAKSKDTLFLEKLEKTLNKEIDNSGFKLENLSKDFNMSYSAIYRKCQTLTGKTIVELFRLIRLKKAAILIAKNGYPIAQASYKVGFNDPNYFSKCFKVEFKITPKSFKKEAKNSDLEHFLAKYHLDSSYIMKET